jgi:hypothetical protein
MCDNSNDLSNVVKDQEKMLTSRILIGTVVSLLSITPGCGDREVSFSKDVKPILDEHCLPCHQAGKDGYIASGLSVESYDDMMKGTKYGPVVMPGYSFSSTLQILVEHKADPSINMPRRGVRMSQDKIELIGRWISQGAQNTSHNRTV